MRLTVVGAGYVGLNCAVSMAYVGHTVHVIEKDKTKYDMLCNWNIPIHEAGLQEVFNLSSVKAKMSFSQDVGDWVATADVIIIAVGTPPSPNGQADTTYVEAAAGEIAEKLKSGKNYTIVIKSTVPIGTNRRVKAIIERELASREVDSKVYVCSNPESLREGRALFDMLYPDRIVIGAYNEEAIESLHTLYRPMLEQSFEPPAVVDRPQNFELPRFIVTTPASAEMIKYAANSFLALKISFINEVAELCEKIGADVTEVARGIGLDSRIGSRFLSAGLGWGGSCFPKDTSALIAIGKENGCEMHITKSSKEVNRKQRVRVVDKLQHTLKGVRGRTIAILGAAFKPGTDDVREAPVIDVIRTLIERGAEVRLHDPVALENAKIVLADFEVNYYDDPYEMVKGADAILLVTEWPYYRTLDMGKIAKSMREKVLFDTRNLFTPADVEEAGLRYLGIGR